MIGRLEAVCDRARADARAGRKAQSPAAWRRGGCLGERRLTYHQWNHYLRAWNRERARMKAAGLLSQLAFDLHDAAASV